MSGGQALGSPLETLGYIVGASQGPSVPPVLLVITLVISCWLECHLCSLFSQPFLFLLPNLCSLLLPSPSSSRFIFLNELRRWSLA